MAREGGLIVDVAGFEKLMDQQRERARKAQKKETIAVEGELAATPTRFLGYDFLETESVVEAVLPGNKADEINVVLDQTPCYAEMGGQVGDRGLLHVPGHDRSEVGQLRVLDTQKRGETYIHRTQLVIQFRQISLYLFGTHPSMVIWIVNPQAFQKRGVIQRGIGGD